MLNEYLLELQNKETELEVIKNTIGELVKTSEIKRFKDEFLRLKVFSEKSQEKLHANTAQQDTKNNELVNLQNEKTEYEEVFENKEITTKKHEKTVENIEKVDTKLDTAKLQLTKLNEEGESINKEILELKKKLSFIKRKYTEIKTHNDNQLESLKNNEKCCEDRIKEICEKIDSDVLNIYQRVKRQHNNPIANVESKKCCGCNVELSSVSYESVKKANELVRCESCGRILIIT